MFMTFTQAGLSLLSLTVTSALLLHSLAALRSHAEQPFCPRRLKSYLESPANTLCPLPPLDHAARGQSQDQAPEALCYLFEFSQLPGKAEFTPFLKPAWQRVLRCP